MPTQIAAGLECEPALSSSELDSVLSHVIVERGMTAFVSNPAGWEVLSPHALADDGHATDGHGAVTAKYLRTRIIVSHARFTRVVKMGKAISLLSVLESAAANSIVNVHSNLPEWAPWLQKQLVTNTLRHDLLLLGVSLLLIFAFLCAYFRNLLVAALAVSQISISFPIMAFIVDVLLRQRPLSVFAGCSLFVVTGVSADNMFVLHETWAQSRFLRVDNAPLSDGQRIRWTIAQAARPLLIADGTTAFSLFINCLSPIPAIFQFGLCGGLLIMINFVLVLCYTPAILLLEERGRLSVPSRCRRAVSSCCHRVHALLHRPTSSAASATQSAEGRAGMGDLAARCVHAVHGAMFNWRKRLLGLVVLGVVALAPSAAQLASNRQGSELNFFSRVDLTMPDDAFPGESGTVQIHAPFSPMPVVEQPAEGWPQAYHRIVQGLGYRFYVLDRPLWPEAAPLVGCLLIADSVVLLLLAKRLKRPKRHATKRRRLRRLAAVLLLLLAVLLDVIALCAFIVWADADSAVVSWGCHYPDVLNALLLSALGTQALLFALIALVYATRKLARRFLAAEELANTSQAQKKRHKKALVFCAISAAFSVAFAIVLSVLIGSGSKGDGSSGVEENASDGPGGEGAARAHTVRWSTSANSVALVLLLHYWAVLPLALALVNHTGEPFLVLMPERDTAASRLAVAASLVGVGTFLSVVWTAFVSYGLSQHSQTDAIRHTLGAALVLTSFAHSFLSWLIACDRQVGFLGCSRRLRRSRLPAAVSQALLSLVMLLAAIMTFGSFHIEGFLFTASLLWLGDGVAFLLVAVVISTRSAVGCLRPLMGADPTAPEGSWTDLVTLNPDVVVAVPALRKDEVRGMLAACFGSYVAVLLGLTGGVVSVSSLSSHASSALTPAWSRLALACTLLVHSLVAAVIAYVFYTGKGLLVLQPTAWSGRSGRPATLATCASLGIAIVAAIILSLTDYSSGGQHDKPYGGQSDGSDSAAPHGTGSDTSGLELPSTSAVELTIGILLVVDAAILSGAAWAHARGRRLGVFCPLPALRRTRLPALGLFSLALLLLLLGAALAVASFLRLHERDVWPVRTPYVIAEVVLALHAQLAAIGVHDIRVHAHKMASTSPSRSRIPSFPSPEEASVRASEEDCEVMRETSPMRAPRQGHGAGSPWPTPPTASFLVFAQPAAHHCKAVASAMVGLALLACVFALVAPAVSRPEGDGRLWYEFFGTALLLAFLVCVSCLQLADWGEHAVQRRSARLALLLAGLSAAAGSATCFFLELVPPKSVVLVGDTLVGPPGLVVPVLFGTLLLIHVPLAAVTAEVQYSGSPVLGMSGRPGVSTHPRRRALGFYLLATLLCTTGAASLAFAFGSVQVDPPPLEYGSSAGAESPYGLAEKCNLVWGLTGNFKERTGSTPSTDLQWVDESGDAWAAERILGFETSHAQVGLAELCDKLMLPGSPVHSEEQPECVMGVFRDHVQENGGNWPLNATAFRSELRAFLNEHMHFSDLVGFTDGSENADVAWIRVRLKSKYRNGGLLTQPDEMRKYINTWTRWIDGLRPDDAPSTSVVGAGWATCTSWEALATLHSFLEGVTRAVLLTPTFCMCVILLCVRDLLICYFAFYAIVAMLITVFGVLQLLGFGLGPIESLSLAVVVGVSVDYLVHLAFAFKNSIMDERYHKSRSVLLARSGSILSAAATTLCAVIPLLGARMVPLNQFGVIFTSVTCISLLLSMGFFNALMMVAGPGASAGPHAVFATCIPVSWRTASAPSESAPDSGCELLQGATGAAAPAAAPSATADGSEAPSSSSSSSLSSTPRQSDQRHRQSLGEQQQHHDTTGGVLGRFVRKDSRVRPE